MLIKFGNLEQQYYKGIFEKAAFGLHKDIMTYISPYLNKNMDALDIGCGEGAFSQRLVDAGINVDVCEIDITQVKAKVNNIIHIDLNLSDFSKNFTKKYDIVFIIEVIEHVENPWQLIRDAKSVLKDNGILVISTPNVSSFPSRLRFFMYGTLVSFEKSDLSYGHITPLPYFQLEHIIESNNLKILNSGDGGIIPWFHIGRPSWFILFRNSLLLLFYPFMKGFKKRRALIYILQKQKS